MQFTATFNIVPKGQARGEDYRVMFPATYGDDLTSIAFRKLAEERPDYVRDPEKVITPLTNISMGNQLSPDHFKAVNDLCEQVDILQAQIRKNTIWLPLAIIVCTGLGLLIGALIW